MRTKVWLPVFALVLSGNGHAQQPAGAGNAPAEADSYPIVLTPTRLRQSLQDVPASVTVITAEMLRKFGVLSIADALRLVPGMAISQPSGNDYRINYHGTNLLTPRRMNVLVDGVSVYQPAFARVDWANLPIAIEDVDRIEVTRGPDSASYGPNSMLAVINIISKHPSDVERGTVAATFGSKGNLGVTARLAGTLGSTALRLTLNKERDSGFDMLMRGGGGSGHDSTGLSRVNLRSQTALNSSTTLDIDAGYVGGTKEVPFGDQYQRSFPDQKVDDSYLSGTLTKSISPTHELRVRATYWSNRVRQQWRSCPPTALLLPEMFALWKANPSYAMTILAGRIPSGGSPLDDALAAQATTAISGLGRRALEPTCASVNQDLSERRADVELQDSYVFSEQFRAVAGIGARWETGESQTYLGGSAANSTWWGFANAEYKPRPWLSLNGGAYAQHDRLSGRTDTSPRLAANVQLTETQGLRFVWSTGTRTPDIEEQRAVWTYSVSDVTPSVNGSSVARFFQSAKSPGGLSSERITSREIGYLLNVPSLGLLFDAKVFDDRLSNLISEKLQLSSYAPTNTGSVRLTGAELQANVALSTDWTLFAEYAYLRNHDASTLLEQTQYSRNSGAFGIWHRFGPGWSTSFAYYGASGDGVAQSSFGRTDITLTRRFQLGTSEAALALIVRRLDNPTQTSFRDFGASNIVQASYNNRMQVFGQFRVSF